MPDRFHKFLDDMDSIRLEADDKVDGMLRNLNVDAVLSNPKAAMQKFALTFLQKNNILFTKGQAEGKKLVSYLEKKND